jgi:hypothetical protein
MIASSMEVTMTTIATKFAAGFILASAAAALMPAGTALAQDADAIRTKCIAEAGGNIITGNIEEGRGRARQVLYADCMRRHGQNP